MPLEIVLILDLVMILLFATVFNYIARFLKQPPLLAYIVAGLFIGPIILGNPDPLSLGGIVRGIFGFSLGITNVEDIMILSELGVALLLFGAGVETNFSKLADLGKVVIIGSLIQVLVTALVVIGATQWLGILDFQQSIYLGMILAFSSTMIVVKMLSDSRQINTLHGRFIIGFLLMQDVLVVLAMPLLNNLQQILDPMLIATFLLQSVLLLAFAYILHKFIYPAFFKYALQSDELLFLGAISSCFVFILLAHLLNFHIGVGAFIAGVSLSTLPYSLEVYNKIRGTRDFFATIFFVTLGIQITPDFLSFPLGIMLFILVVVFLLKPLIYFLITLFFGYGERVSFVVALALAQVSEFSFILASQGKTILDATPGLYSSIILIIAVSMAVTPYLMTYSSSAYTLFDRVTERITLPLKRSSRLHRKIRQLENVPQRMENHIIIVGGGTMGYSIASALHKEHPLVVIDHDSEVIFSCTRKGINASLGSADNTEVMERVNLRNAKLLIIAIPDIKESMFLVNYARKINKNVVIFARAHYYRGALELYNKGVDFVIMPLIIAGNVLLKDIVKYLETGKTYEINKFRDEYITYLREKVKEEKEHFKM